MKHLLRSPSDQALVLMGEKCFSPWSQVIEGVSVAGEASAAFILDSSGCGFEVLGSHNFYLGQRSIIDWRQSPREFTQFDDTYFDVLDREILRFLKLCGVDLSDIQLILPHNVNLSSWKVMAERWNRDLEKFYLKNVSTVGHCFNADAYLNLRSADEEGLIREGDLCLLVSVGLGATYSFALIKKE